MKGRLFYIVGASGVGKDSLIQYARERLADDDSVLFAHRYITRAMSAKGENHIALTEREFALRERNGLFALAWRSHGFRYGVGVEIDLWIERACTVVVSGSREFLPQARARYPDISVVWVSARPQVLATRLRGRGRESGNEMIERLARNSRVKAAPPADALHIRNEGSIERAGSELFDVLMGKR
jgi:ribose 1,5-bisphosphokinase